MMINYKRVRRIKAAIYTVLILLLFLPLALMILVFAKISGLEQRQDRLASALADATVQVQNAAGSLDRAIAGYKAPSIPLPEASEKEKTEEPKEETSPEADSLETKAGAESSSQGEQGQEPLSEPDNLAQGGTGESSGGFAPSSESANPPGTSSGEGWYLSPPLTGK